MATETAWRHCQDCDVEWFGGPGCWFCGNETGSRCFPSTVKQGGLPDMHRERAYACEECGNDDPTEGYRVCMDCLEELQPAT